MSTRPKIVVFAGSLRKESWNKKLAKAAANFVNEAGGEATYIDLLDYQMPLYNEDDETASGLPPKASELKKLFKQHHGLIIASPEYNSSVSAVLKNTIDWLSRPLEDKTPLEAFDGKVAGLFGSSAGALGGLRGLVTLRSILGNIKVHVLPDQYALGKVDQAFDAAGKLKDEAQQKAVQAVAQKVVKVAGALK